MANPEEVNYESTLAGYQETEMAFQSGQQMKADAGDDTLLVRFSLEPKEDRKASQEAGRLICRETVYVEIMIPGNKDSIVKRPASDFDKRRFHAQFKAFENNVSQDGITGTLLEDWPGINRAQVEELKFMHIRTVEQLAKVSDGNSQNFMGIQKLKNEARAYLELSGVASDAKAMAAELETRDLEIAELKQTNAEFLARLKKLEAAQKAD